jgi:hypothetical protein
MPSFDLNISYSTGPAHYLPLGTDVEAQDSSDKTFFLLDPTGSFALKVSDCAAAFLNSRLNMKFHLSRPGSSGWIAKQVQYRPPNKELETNSNVAILVYVPLDSAHTRVLQVYARLTGYPGDAPIYSD